MIFLEALSLASNLLSVFSRLLGDDDSSSSPSTPSDLKAILEAQKNVNILPAVNTQILGLESNLLKEQTDLASQLASASQLVRPETYDRR